MVRRSLGAALWSLVGLFACFLGGLSALVGTGAGRAPPPPSRVLLRNVPIDDGTVVVGLQSPPSRGDPALEIELAGADGRRRIRRFEHLEARFGSLRLSSPAARGIRADVQALAVAISDPRPRITHPPARLTALAHSLPPPVRPLPTPP